MKKPALETYGLVPCRRHPGLHPAIAICHHLARGIYLGVYSPGHTESDVLEAWCAQCDDVLCSEETWTEEALQFAEFRTVCSHCFDTILARNEREGPGRG